MPCVIVRISAYFFSFVCLCDILGLFCLLLIVNAAWLFNWVMFCSLSHWQMTTFYSRFQLLTYPFVSISHQHTCAWALISHPFLSVNSFNFSQILAVIYCWFLLSLFSSLSLILFLSFCAALDSLLLTLCSILMHRPPVGL